jgi:hypothetical protein
VKNGGLGGVCTIVFVMGNRREEAESPSERRKRPKIHVLNQAVRG